jgi:hypothetical protein
LNILDILEWLDNRFLNTFDSHHFFLLSYILWGRLKRTLFGVSLFETKSIEFHDRILIDPHIHMCLSSM